MKDPGQSRPGSAPDPGPSEGEKLRFLETELRIERVRKRAILFVLVGTAALELSRLLGRIVHGSLPIFGAAFCLVYVFYGLYLYSTQEPFYRRAKRRREGGSEEGGVGETEPGGDGPHGSRRGAP